MRNQHICWATSPKNSLIVRKPLMIKIILNDKNHQALSQKFRQLHIYIYIFKINLARYIYIYIYIYVMWIFIIYVTTCESVRFRCNRLRILIRKKVVLKIKFVSFVRMKVDFLWKMNDNKKGVMLISLNSVFTLYIYMRTIFFMLSLGCIYQWSFDFIYERVAKCSLF